MLPSTVIFPPNPVLHIWGCIAEQGCCAAIEHPGSLRYRPVDDSGRYVASPRSWVAPSLALTLSLSDMYNENLSSVLVPGAPARRALRASVWSGRGRDRS